MRLLLTICALCGSLSLSLAQGIQGNVTISGSAQVMVTGHSVSLTWNASQNATSYNVYRGTTHGGPYAGLASAGPSTAYTDAQVTHDQTWYYVVTAVNGSGESGYSNEAVATIP